MIFMPFAFLIDHFGLWLRLSLLYTLVLSLLSWGLGYLYVCAGTAETAGFYCRNSVPVYLLYLFLRIAFLGLFCAKWIEAAAEKKFFRGGRLSCRMFGLGARPDCCWLWPD